MKKFLALLLVLVMAFSCVLVSCNKDNEDPENTSDDDDDFIGLGTGTGTGTGTSGTGVETGNTHTDFTWTDVNETVYVSVARLSVRTDTLVSEETYKGTITFGQSYKRIKYNAQWSLIEYDGGEYYVSSKYVTTDDGSVTFTNVDNKTVYVCAEKALNLREWTDASADADNIEVLVKRGVALTQTGVSKNGKWVRVSYESKTLYCSANYVSETAPTDDDTGSGTQDDTSNLG
ncbi:MAG: hypothetical protein IJ038_01615 [Clostridia bacterium]|nr:hypothetical protein [Clostridia bacterium]